MNLNKKDKQDNRISRLGRTLGFIGGYLLFNASLFFIFLVFNKIPGNWSYFHFASITLLITLIGLVIKLLTGDNEDGNTIGTHPFLGGFRMFGRCVGLIVNSILLTIVYIFGVGLSSLLAKLFKKHFLDLKTKEENSTYWMNLNLRKKSLKDYYRQF